MTPYILRELRLAGRRLRTNPAFTTAAVASLGLAIALTTTIFGVIDAMVRPALPIARPAELFAVGFGAPHPPAAIDAERFRALQAESRLVAGAAAIGSSPVGWQVAIQSPRGDVSGKQAAGVTGGFFAVLGTHAARGRLFAGTREEYAARAAVISYDLWAQLGGDGTRGFAPFPIRMNGRVFTVIGVLPPKGAYPRYRDVFVLVSDARAAGRYLVRLRPGTTRTEARAALQLFASRFGMVAHHEGRATPVPFYFEPAIRVPARVNGTYAALMLAAITMLVLACGNIANLQLARGLTRSNELAIRYALGASRGRVVVHVLTESAVIAGAGGVLGVLMSVGAIALLRAIVPPNSGWFGLSVPQLSWRVVAFGVGITALTLLLVGIAPALRLSRRDPAALLGAGRGTSQMRRARGGHHILVATEVAGALMLVSVASLLIGTARRMDGIDVGYDPHNLLYANVSLRAHGDAADAGTITARTARMKTLLERLRGMARVRSAASSVELGADGHAVTVDDPSGDSREIRVTQVTARLVSADYLRTLRLPVVRGHDFAHGDNGAIAEAIVDETAAERFWPGQNPVGRMIKLGSARSDRPWVRVIGVARRSVFVASMGCLPENGCAWPGIFVHDADVARYGGTLTRPADIARAVAFVIRARSHPMQLALMLRRGDWLGSPQTYFGIYDWAATTGLDDLRASRHVMAGLFTAFAVFGLALAMIGIYGVTSHSVARRTPEFGIRMALGATPGEILRLVLREGNAIALAGIALGLLLAAWGMRLIGAFLYGVDRAVPVLFAAAIVGIFATVILASLVPAIRATRASPMDALRAE